MTALASSPVTKCVYTSTPTPVADEYTALGWGAPAADGDEVLDCADHFAAKAAVDGIYAVSVTVNAGEQHSDDSAFVELDLGGSAFASQTLPLGSDSGLPQVNLACTFPLTAGDEIKVSAKQSAGPGVTLQFAAVVTCIAVA